jgi:beta-lactam-binding protein with PASTA domain
MAAPSRLPRLLAPVVLLLAVLFGAWFWLKLYTRHDARVEVPELKGLTADEARTALATKDLLLEVVDSVYNDEAPKSTVVEQDPDPGKAVKPGRTIYLVMNASQPKMLDMPELVNLSKRQALSVVDILGIKVKELKYRPDPCVDCVVAQLYKGKAIPAGAHIRRGDAITLVLGSGSEGEPVQVPDMRGVPYPELRAALMTRSLNLGVVVECPGCNTAADSALSRVARQSPEPYLNNMIGAGGMVDVWLTLDTAGLPAWTPPANTNGTNDDQEDL